MRLHRLRVRLATWLVRGTGHQVLSQVEYRALTEIILAQADVILDRASRPVVTIHRPARGDKQRWMH